MKYLGYILITPLLLIFMAFFILAIFSPLIIAYKFDAPLIYWIFLGAMYGAFSGMLILDTKSPINLGKNSNIKRLPVKYDDIDNLEDLKKLFKNEKE